MIAALALAALAADDDVGGVRIESLGSGASVSIAEDSVVGRTGGINATTLRVTAGGDRTTFVAEVPFAAYRNASDERDIGLGNVQLGIWNHAGGDRLRSSVGIEMWAHVGNGRAWTWTNDSTAIWPGSGARVAWQGLAGTASTRAMFRGDIGLGFSRGYDPVPGLTFRMGAAAGIDQDLGKRFGLTGEAALTYWDMSPFELTGLVRCDPIENVRLRAGLVLPVAVWAGWTPSGQAAGVSESTIRLDLTVRL